MGDDCGSATEPECPLWLGSLARRGAPPTGGGWKQPEREGAPLWLGSVTRREGRQQEPPRFTARSDVTAWLGSRARRRLAASPPSTEPARVQPSVVPLAERREQAAPPAPPARQDPRLAVGELGMTLRVA